MIRIFTHLRDYFDSKYHKLNIIYSQEFLLQKISIFLVFLIQTVSYQEVTVFDGHIIPGTPFGYLLTQRGKPSLIKHGILY
jgi:hypothetical protein